MGLLSRFMMNKARKAACSSAVPSITPEATWIQSWLAASRQHSILSITTNDILFVWDLLLHAIHPLDCIILGLAGWATVPLFRLVYSFGPFPKKQCFVDSYLYQVADHISQIARLSAVVYAADCILAIMVGMGFNFHHLESFSWGFAKILFACWAAQRLAVLKRYVLTQIVTAHGPKQLGRASVVDRLLDGMIFLCTIMFLLDILDVEMGIGVTSMFAFGSAGTLMVGLASRDVAAMIVNGLALSTTNRFNQGDSVKFGDGTTGVVDKIGWMETTIRNYDNLLEVVPNNELGMQRVKNISRSLYCQIKQTLRFHYDDAEKLPKCLNDIMEEIKLSCHDVITDGTRPFRATWRHYRPDHLEVVVDTHHHGKPLGKRYWNNVQEVNLAIYRAVKKNQVRFVTTWAPFETNTKKKK